jgi:hypothetical protein
MSIELPKVNNTIIDSRTQAFTITNVNLESPARKDPTTGGVTISMRSEEEIKRVTSTFIMENKTIFEELAKL